MTASSDAARDAPTSNDPSTAAAAAAYIVAAATAADNGASTSRTAAPATTACGRSKRSCNGTFRALQPAAACARRCGAAEPWRRRAATATASVFAAGVPEPRPARRRLRGALRRTRVTASASASDDVASDAALMRYVRAGPLYAAVPPAQQAPDAAPMWRELGEHLARAMHIALHEERSAVRIFHYYLPVFFWLRDTVRRVRQARQRRVHGARGDGGGRCVTVGIQCPQGGGKTTITAFLRELFARHGQSCAVVSIDDFYRTRAAQRALAEAHPDNPLLQYRGNPGTHDIDLALDTLHRLCGGGGGGDNDADDDVNSVAVPRYDKAAFDGLGDRAPREHWPRVRKPVDVVLLEGWCLGFRPLADAARLRAVDPNLLPVNEYLRDDFARLYDGGGTLDAFIVIGLEGEPLERATQIVYEWRVEAERELRRRAHGGGGMSDEQVRIFVDRFMPAYRAYLRELYDGESVVGDRRNELRLRINAARQPTRLMP